MYDQIKEKSKKPLLALFLTLGLIILPACSPHPASGTWVSTGDNEYNYSKILIHFKPQLEIYTQGAEKPVQYCGWSAVTKQSIEMGCMSSNEQRVEDRYHFNILSKANAELIKDGKVIASFILVDEK